MVQRKAKYYKTSHVRTDLHAIDWFIAAISHLRQQQAEISTYKHKQSHGGEYELEFEL